MRLPRVCAMTAAAVAAVVIFTGARTQAAGGPVTLIALTFGANSLMGFNSATPGTVGIFPITGMVAGDTMRAIDFRPSAPGMLYGAATDAAGTLIRTYRINPKSGVATPLSSQAGPLGAGVSWGMSFIPTVDRIRLVNSSDENARVNPITGALAGDDVNLSLAGQLADSVAYTKGQLGVTGTSTAYVIARASNSLKLLGGINGTPSPNGGVLTTIGSLGVAIAAGSSTGLDFTRDGRLFASLQVGASTGLYDVNPATGAATLVGAIGAGTTPVASLAAYEPKAPLDFDGDGSTDATVMRNIGGSWFWFIRQSISGALSVINWGAPSDVLLSDDFDDDGVADVSAWRPGAQATWFARPSSSGGFTALPWGTTGDDPRALGDYDGDGRADYAILRDDGNWYLLRSTNGLLVQGFGLSGDRATPADFDADGRTDLAVRRIVGPSIVFYLNRSIAGFTAFQWGLAGDAIAMGDYDGDGLDDVTVVRDQGGQRVWYVRQSATGGLLVVSWGLTGDLLTPGDYDGDGFTDVAIWRPSSGTFYIRPSSTGGLQTIYWGLAGDVPPASIIAQ